MRTLLTAALALVCMAAVPPARADEASRRAKAEQMLSLTHTDELMKQQLGNLQTRIADMAKQQATRDGMTPEQTRLTGEYMAAVQKISDDEVGWTRLRPILIESYAQTFSDADLDAILTFYKSPAGQAIVAKTPELSQKTMDMVQANIKDMQPKLEAVTRSYVEKLQAVSTPAAPANTAAPSSTAAPAKAAAPARSTAK